MTISNSFSSFVATLPRPLVFGLQGVYGCKLLQCAAGCREGRGRGVGVVGVVVGGGHQIREEILD